MMLLLRPSKRTVNSTNNVTDGYYDVHDYDLGKTVRETIHNIDAKDVTIISRAVDPERRPLL